MRRKPDPLPEPFAHPSRVRSAPATRGPMPSRTEAAALRIVIAYLRKCERVQRDSGGLRCIPTLRRKLALTFPET